MGTLMLTHKLNPLFVLSPSICRSPVCGRHPSRVYPWLYKRIKICKLVCWWTRWMGNDNTIIIILHEKEHTWFYSEKESQLIGQTFTLNYAKMSNNAHWFNKCIEHKYFVDNTFHTKFVPVFINAVKYPVLCAIIVKTFAGTLVACLDIKTSLYATQMVLL